MKDDTRSVVHVEERTVGARPVGSDRVLALLRELALRPQGATLDELARSILGAKSTVHRGLATLRRAGFANQDANGRYLLGDELVRLAFANHEARPDHIRVRPALQALTERFGETSHYAVLDGRDVVYRDKVDPQVGAIRLTSSIGGRNPAHCTAVGKLLLAYALRDADSVVAWVRLRALERRTPHTLIDEHQLHREFEKIREHGYAVDDQENELGVNCVALPVRFRTGSRPEAAISISAIAYRTPLHALVDNIDEIRCAIGTVVPS